MFITAFLIAIVWTWFQYGVGAAVVLSLLGFVLFSACLRWRSLWFIALSVWVLASLEVNVGHVLTKEHQHEVYPLTVCVSQSPKIFSDDYTSAYASVVNQPDFLNLRHIKISLNSAVSTTIPALESGDCLEGDVRLRQPFGRIVPGSFNVDRYNFAHQIDAFGSFVVVRNVTNTPSFAQKLFLKRYHAFEKSNARDIWAALALGWSYSMSSDLKSTLAANQIMHIFVVSGMHLAFIGLFVGLFVQWIAFLISRFVIVSYKAKMAVVVTLLFFYVALIGFPIPAVRSLIMMLIPFLVFWFGVKLRWYRSLAIAALIITLWHPESWLSIGPWLSFSSVGLILLVNHWQLIHKVKWLFSILIFQFIMSLSILPWAFLGGFQVNLLSFFINLILTPLVTIVGLPVVALISMTTWQWPVQLLENGVSYLTGWLARFADFGFQLHYFHPSLVITVILFALYFFWRRQIVSYIPLLVGMFVFLASTFQNTTLGIL